MALLLALSLSLPQNSLAETSEECALNQLPCAGLPAPLCCAADSVCNALAGNTTVLCCPKGRSCDKIRPITCDVRSQDPRGKDSLGAPIKTLVLGGKPH
ncbi:hypothetical protein CDD80_7365 [Ophiocordyceps camponoti-rufipedis]|uniref:Granulins domain-containing protein n=1 Tax=Ophiocordyceps camponoti-rufipedis TaxID=2004952 RepID=A0A2C5YMD1_9HYPO|nr:hypothetical protein CDD80_7365 [Ophiocordyceps camponoti-rufipedis]